MKKLRLAALTAAFMLLGAVNAFAGDTFANGTYVNGISLAGQTVEQAKAYIEGSYSQNYTLTLRGKNGTTETINGSDIGYQAQAPTNLAAILADENAKNMQGGSYTGDGMNASFSEEAVRTKLGELNMVKNARKTQNATISSTRPFKVIPEVQGNSYNMDKLLEVVKLALTSGVQSVDLNAYDVLDSISVTAASLQDTCRRMNEMGDLTITTNVLGHKEELKGSTIAEWITGAENGKLTLDQSKVAAYVAEIANRYDDSGNTQTFHSASGKDVVMSTSYGVHIDQAAEAVSLTEAIQNLQTVEREPAYSCKPVQYDMPQFGNTFAEVDLGLQHVYFYQDGQCVWDSACVTGKATDPNRATPAGVFSLTYKQRDRVLKGKLVNGKPEYESPVSYWMPFNGGIGFHDATWRSQFGGSIYVNSGSHGCINLPKDKAAALYNLVNKGTIVVVHE